jgi:hypothetical protein
LDEYLAQTGQRRTRIRSFGPSDLLLYVGYAHSNFDHSYFDFIDFGAQVGTLVPTGQKTNENLVFSLPLGFDGHWAIPFLFNSAVGAYEWLTAGIALDGLIFIPTKRNMRIKTDPESSGIILPTTQRAKVHKKPQVSLSGYIKADHFSRGFSLMLGYSFTYQGATSLAFTAEQSAVTIANTDKRLRSWQMQTLHAGIEYDFATPFDTIGPRVNVFYDKILSGKSVFLTSLWSGTAGIDINWQF